VPWPGLSVQLSRMPYTGGSPSARSEVLFCCGASAYNKPIAQWAELVVNASRRLLPTIQRATPASVPPDPIRFAWLNDLYPKSFHVRAQR